MTPRFAFAALAVLTLFGSTFDARAAVVLRSAELTRHSEVVPRGGPAEVTDTTEPFPNDANKFAGVGPEGLRVSVDELSGTHAFINGNLIISTASDSGFRVVFEVDEPSAFTYHRPPRGDVPPRDWGAVFLREEGGASVINGFNHYGDLAGVLPPGRYTFTGNTATPPVPGPLPGTSASTLRDVRLTVVPEPAGLLAAAGLALCLGRRRRTRE